MNPTEFPAVFAQLPLEHRAALLANPHGALPPHLAQQLLGHIFTSYWVDQPDNTRQWRLHVSEGNALQEERVRLDQWWQRRSEAERAALIEHRGGQMPGELREAVKDHIPGGVVHGDDLTGPFTVPPVMIAYVEMMAGAE